MKEEIEEIENTLKVSKPYNELGTYNYFNCESIEKLLEENKSLQSQLKAKEEAENTFKEWIATEQFRLARSVSHTYKDSLNKTHLVNEDIFDELAIVLDKYNEILSKGENK